MRFSSALGLTVIRDGSASNVKKKPEEQWRGFIVEIFRSLSDKMACACSLSCKFHFYVSSEVGAQQLLRMTEDYIRRLAEAQVLFYNVKRIVVMFVGKISKTINFIDKSIKAKSFIDSS